MRWTRAESELVDPVRDALSGVAELRHGPGSGVTLGDILGTWDGASGLGPKRAPCGGGGVSCAGQPSSGAAATAWTSDCDTGRRASLLNRGGCFRSPAAVLTAAAGIYEMVRNCSPPDSPKGPGGVISARVMPE